MRCQLFVLNFAGRTTNIEMGGRGRGGAHQTPVAFRTGLKKTTTHEEDDAKRMTTTQEE